MLLIISFESDYTTRAHPKILKRLIGTNMMALSGYGNLYSKSELHGISKICQSYYIPLYINGARLAYGIASNETDVTLEDVAALSDIFYIDGTKVGALCGEAIVIRKNNMPPHFVTLAKQRGLFLQKDGCWEFSLIHCLQVDYTIRMGGTLSFRRINWFVS